MQGVQGRSTRTSSQVVLFSQAAVWYASSDTSPKGSDHHTTPTLLFSTTSDPCECVLCVVAEDEVNPDQLGGMSSACRLQFHHTSPSITAAASVPRRPLHPSSLRPYVRP